MSGISATMRIERDDLQSHQLIMWRLFRFLSGAQDTFLNQFLSNLDDI